MDQVLLTNLIGYAATVVGTFLMMPQVVRAIRTKHMGDVSSVMIVAYIVNCILWLAYGFLLASIPLMLCNGTALIIAIVQAILKRKYK